MRGRVARGLGRKVPMSQPVKAQEPSMEEILASIRRIIADDDAGKPASAKPARAPITATARAAAKNRQADIDAMPGGAEAAGDQEPDDPAQAPVTAEVIALAEAMQAKAPAANGINHSTDGIIDEAPGAAHPHAPQEPRTTPAPDRALLSPRTTAAVDTAFNSLAHTVLAQNPRTLEDLVREMLKPMLKAWLDDNLPSTVERLVRAEIERVSRGRG
jgi:cell pole-organizing protein PopZ